jgi:hypothetical protein
MTVAVTNTTLSLYDAETAVTANAATSAVIDEVEVFTVTPTKAGHKVSIIMTNAAGHGAYTWSLPVGSLWASDTATALTGSIAAGATEVIQLASGKHLSAAGTYPITLTPASGKRLLTDHAAVMEVLETV